MVDFLKNFFVNMTKDSIQDVLLVVFLFFVFSWLYDIIKYYKYTILGFFMPFKKVDFGILIQRLNYIKNHDVKNVNIFCEKRKYIFVDFMNFRINNIIKIIEEMQSKNVLKMENEEFYLYLKEKIYNAIERADNDILSNNIPYIILEKYKQIEDDEIKIFDKFLKQVCFSKRVYGNNNDKVFIILDFMCVIIKMSVINAESVIDELNGQLDGILYRGVSCSNCNRKECKKYQSKAEIKDV